MHNLQIKMRYAVVLMMGVLLMNSCLTLNAQSNNLKPKMKSKLKSSLNAFSLNKPLTEGTMNLDDLLEYSAARGFVPIKILIYRRLRNRHQVVMLQK